MNNSTAAFYSVATSHSGSLLVTEIKHKNQTIYTCEICKLGYLDGQTANDCENFCRTHDACSLKITKKAIYKP
jgi:hypothetical protein